MRLDRFLCVPFVPGGRDWSGCDCYGLVRLVLKELAGVEIAAYASVKGGDPAEEARAITEALAGRSWLPVPRQSAREFDCVLFSLAQMGGFPRNNHIGVLLGTELVLHTAPPIGASFVSLGHPTIKTRIKGFYRHTSLAAP